MRREQQPGKGGGGEEEGGCVDTFKKPRDQFVDYVLEGLVSSGKKHTGPDQRPSYPDPPRSGIPLRTSLP